MHFQGYFHALRIEKFRKNIHVTLLCPGPTFTNFLQESFTEKAEEVRNKLIFQFSNIYSTAIMSFESVLQSETFQLFNRTYATCVPKVMDDVKKYLYSKIVSSIWKCNGSRSIFSARCTVDGFFLKGYWEFNTRFFGCSRWFQNEYLSALIWIWETKRNQKIRACGFRYYRECHSCSKFSDRVEGLTAVE